ncbi:NTP transferase domain-containing protein [Nostocoides sp. F2B08]|nr:NTP transferase domain-containing protein [Tetrasphaera sp. F2B08]
MGRPKALVHDEAGRPWLHRAVDALRDGGCDHVIVVLGARAGEAERLLDGMVVTVVTAEDWAAGMSASLRTGLLAAVDHVRRTPRDVGAVVVTLVDLPDVDSRVVERVIRQVGTDPSALGRATYDGSPGHPVLIGLDHVEAVLATTSEDKGARDYLREQGLTLVECSDLATGHDVDSPPT